MMYSLSISLIIFLIKSSFIKNKMIKNILNLHYFKYRYFYNFNKVL
jgi:hypothetical protein